MRLIIGGAYQGKRRYVADKYGIDIAEMKDCMNANTTELVNSKCIYNFHLFIKSKLEVGQEFSEIVKFTKLLLENERNIIIIMDEVGSGIISMEKREREWREAVGRIGCILAENAESVERIACGCAVKIK